MANRWGSNGNSERLYFLGLPIFADGDCSHEIKRCLLFGRKVMTNLDSTLKTRDVTLPTNVCLVKAMVFPVVMYEYESWTLKKAEHRRIDAFELWCWRRLESPLDNKEIKPVRAKGNQPWILEGLMPKLKFQYFGHLMQRVNSLEKTLMLGKIGGGEKGVTENEMVGWYHLTQWTWVWADSGRQWRKGSLACFQAHGVSKSGTRLSNWTVNSKGVNLVKQFINTFSLLKLNRDT